jgi:hypothetical protein
MVTDTEIVCQSLERVAEYDTDLVTLVYDKFAEKMPDANQNIGIMDSRMRGRMLDQIYKLLLDDVDPGYLEFEAGMHRGYGADLAHYRGILEALKDSVCSVLSDAWSVDEDAAWNRTIARIVGDISLITHT